MDEHEERSLEAAGEPEQPDEVVREIAEQVELAAGDAEQQGMSSIARAERALAGDFGFLRSIDALQQNTARLLAPYLAVERQLAQISIPVLEASRMVDALAPMRVALAAQQAEFERLAQSSKMLLEPHQLLAQQLNQRVTDAYTLLSLAPGLADPGAWLRALGAHRPRNWAGLVWDEPRVVAASSILVQEGIPLAWVPRTEIVNELMAAADEPERLDILTQRTEEITEDCRVALEETRAPILAPLVTLLEQALGGLKTAPAPSQALAANIFDTFLRDAKQRGTLFDVHLGERKEGKKGGFYADYRDRVEPVSDKTVAGEYRIACVLTPTIPALASFNDTDPPPSRFGRHATAHRVDPAQYTPANAVIAVMLATSILREAHESVW